MDFHGEKDSGEVLKAVEQANFMNDLFDLLLLDMAPTVMDLFVAAWHVSRLFDLYIAYVALLTGVVYVWVGISFTRWAQPYRRTYAKNSQTESRMLYESIPNWHTVMYFNRFDYEQKRYKGAVSASVNAKRTYRCIIYIGMLYSQQS